VKIIFFLPLFFSSLAIAAGGPYDGIWHFPPYGYINISEDNRTVVAVNVYNQEWGGDWEAFMGPRDKNIIRVTSITNPNIITVFKLRMRSDTTFTGTLESCIPASLCKFPEGFTFEGVKVW